MTDGLYCTNVCGTEFKVTGEDDDDNETDGGALSKHVNIQITWTTIENKNFTKISCYNTQGQHHSVMIHFIINIFSSACSFQMINAGSS